MNLSEVAIRRPVLTAMVSLSLIVLGWLGYARLGVDLYPDVAMPFCMVTTVYPGAGPTDIESQVTRPIEDAVAGIPGVQRLFSSSRENVSVVLVQFKMKVAPQEAVQNVRDKIGAAVGLLPHGAEVPVISRYDIGAQPILVFTASSKDSRDALALHDLLNDQVRPRLEQVEGVAAARIIGGAGREVAVELDSDRLAKLQLTPDVVFGRIRAEHLDLPGGRYEEGPLEIGVRVRGEFASIDELQRMVIANLPNHTQVLLKDVATVHEIAAESHTLVRTNGQEAIAVEVVKQSGANTVQVAERVKAELAKLHAEMKGSLASDIIIDQSAHIEANAHEVWIAIYFGGAMAVLIILVFLMDLRGTFISALALPTSVVGTLWAMWAMNFTINQLSLLGLSLAIGLLIDDAVVVRESITRRLDAGEDPVTAAREGTREIALAVMATTFTLCAVFVPVAFMEGIVGQFFRQFGLTVTAAVLISLFVAFSLDPMLSARLVRRHGQKRGRVVNVLETFFARLDQGYHKSLMWVLAHSKTVILLAAVLFGVSLFVATRLGHDFLGEEDRGQLSVRIQFPPGTHLASTAARTKDAEAAIMQLPGFKSIYSVVGAEGNTDTVTWRLSFVNKTERSQTIAEYKKQVREIVQKIPETKSIVANPPGLEGLGDWPPIWMQIIGPDLKVLQKEAEIVANILHDIPGATDVQMKDSPGRPELQVNVDREAAGRIDLPAGVVAMQVRLATLGNIAGRLRDGRRVADIRVRLADADRDSPEKLKDLRIAGPRGFVPLSQIATLVRADGPSVIEHERRERQIGVTAEIKSGADLGTVAKQLREKLTAHPLPPGYSYVYNGQQSDMADMNADLGTALGLAIVFIFMVLASQFESVLHPFTIMLSLPLAIVGAVLALALTDNDLALGANIGVVLLMGLVTKNSILLVDGALQYMARGASAAEGMLYAGPRRLRPILMTSAAMVLGMLPTALGRGLGSEFRSPMAIAVIGGVITSTLLTLWVIPVVFLWMDKLRFWRRGRA